MRRLAVLTLFGVALVATPTLVSALDAQAAPEAAAPQPAPDGRPLIQKTAAFIGSADKLAGIKSLRQTSTLRANTPQGEMDIHMEELIVLPDRHRQVVEMPMGTITVVVSPASSFMLVPMMGSGPQDMPAAQQESALKQVRTNLVSVLQRAGDPDVSFRITGTEKIGDIEAQIVTIAIDDTEARWWIDPANGRLLRTATETTTMMGATAEQVVDMSDWKEVDGLRFPSKASVKQEGQDVGSLEVLEIQVNPPVDEKLFEKPAATAAQ